MPTDAHIGKKRNEVERQKEDASRPLDPFLVGSPFSLNATKRERERERAILRKSRGG